METGELKLSVNENDIPMDRFTSGFISSVLEAMLKTLRDTADVKRLTLSIIGEKVDINLNNAIVPANPFVSKVFRNTIIGMVSSLRGVDEIKELKIQMTR